MAGNCISKSRTVSEQVSSRRTPYQRSGKFSLWKNHSRIGLLLLLVPEDPIIVALEAQSVYQN